MIFFSDTFTMMRQCSKLFSCKYARDDVNVHTCTLTYFDKVFLESEKLLVSNIANIIEIYIRIIHIPPGREDPRAGGHGGRLAVAAAAPGALPWRGWRGVGGDS